MRSIRVGHHRRRITLQVQSGTTKDAFGQTTPIWTDVANYWAEVYPTRVRDLVVSQQVKSQISHTVRMRYLGSSVSIGPATHRFKLGTRILGIIGYLDVEERHRLYEIACQEIET